MGSDGNLAMGGERAVYHPSEANLVVDKQMNINPAITRNLSRKGSTRVGDSIPIVNQRVAATSSHGDSMPEKESVVATDDCVGPRLHHQITISDDTISDTVVVESKHLARKFSFRNQIAIDPRRMFMFFATMSSLGTMLLIYFTLSSTSKLD